MYDLIGFFDVLTIPTDAGPGQFRIVIDGITGEILVIDSNNVVRGRITAASDDTFQTISPSGDSATLFSTINTAGISFTPANTSKTYVRGFIRSDTDGLDSPFLQIASPQILGELGGIINIFGANGSLKPNVNISASTNTDFRIHGHTAPRGIWDEFRSTVNSSTLTGTGVTDMVITDAGTGVNGIVGDRSGVVGGRRYEIRLNVLAQLSAAPAQWNLFVRVGGANIGRIARLDTTGGILNFPINATLPWVPGADSSTLDIDIHAVENSGAGDLTLLGSVDNLLRLLTLTDVGSNV